MHTEQRVAPRAVYAVALALVLAAAGVSGAEYSWQKPQAKVVATGDLEWAPHPFVFRAGKEVRYIDFQGGSDDNDGKTKATPWKHHPWDPNATGRGRPRARARHLRLQMRRHLPRRAEGPRTPVSRVSPSG